MCARGCCCFTWELCCVQVNVECKCVNAECLMDLLCFPFQKSLKHLFRPRCVTEVCKNRFLSHTCVISFEECNQHCVQRANREEVGGVTWEAFLLECGGTARDKKQNKTVNFRSGWYFKLKAASILTMDCCCRKAQPRLRFEALQFWVLLSNDGLIDCFYIPPLVWHCCTACFIGLQRIYYEGLHLEMLWSLFSGKRMN